MKKVVALITAEAQAGSGYREFPVQRVEAYSVDTSMDQDSDTFSLDIGDPNHDLAFLLRRDNEVRVTLLTEASDKTITRLQTGIADQVQYTGEDGLLSISGRDLSCLATDSQADPGRLYSVLPHVLVKQQANDLGIKKTQLIEVDKFGRTYTDGSETFWEFWYRLYRKRKKWIWLEPDGTLIADNLHYTNAPTYFFGRPPAGDTQPSRWINVERLGVMVDKRKRLYQMWVFGTDVYGRGFLSEGIDRTIEKWLRRPKRIITAPEDTTKKEAQETADEEIFESIVGALEIILVVRDQEVIIRQNNMAQVNLPQVGFEGLFFVVGNTVMGGQDGYTQIVRLREKNFALSRRVPDDPELEDDPVSSEPDPAAIDPGPFLGAGARWVQAFASAAQEFHDGWNYGLFLGVLLAICDVESSFRNVRNPDTGGEWRPLESVIRGGGSNAEARWHADFANSRSNSLNPRSPESEAAVGPMQLVTPHYKDWADGYGGKEGEYDGGRWVPEANIRAGARAFGTEKLSGLDSSKADQIWIGVERYLGSSPAENLVYRNKVFRVWQEKYQGLTEGLTDDPNSEIGDDPDQATYAVRDASGQPFTVKVPSGAPRSVKVAVNYLVKQIGKPYQLGAEGPSSFDCSGLAWAAWHQAGVPSIEPRDTTWGYFKQGRFPSVNRGSLLCGDWVFFHEVGHMGIYLNDNHFIHAPHTGDVVKISPLTGWYSENYDGARRIVAWGSGGD